MVCKSVILFVYLMFVLIVRFCVRCVILILVGLSKWERYMEVVLLFVVVLVVIIVFEILLFIRWVIRFLRLILFGLILFMGEMSLCKIW